MIYNLLVGADKSYPGPLKNHRGARSPPDSCIPALPAGPWHVAEGESLLESAPMQLSNSLEGFPALGSAGMGWMKQGWIQG